MSRLQDIESCPRRWALAAADYPEIWSEGGYPRLTGLRAIVGQVVHRSLERIGQALSAAGCSSIDSDHFYEVLVGLGGYTRLLEEELAHVLAGERTNPRVARTLATTEARLRARVPQMRARLQLLVSRLALSPRAGGPATAGRARRGALGPGAHSEVLLHVPQLGWKGFADFINLIDSECEILDFKTGARREEHEFQLRVYALLWARDASANPTGRLATKLTVVHVDGETDVAPPSAPELSALEDELQERTAHARSAIDKRPPPARPSVAACSLCHVRHMCDAYWNPATQAALWSGRDVPDVRPFAHAVDLQVETTGRLGPTVWTATAESSPMHPPGSKVELRAGHADPQVLQVLQTGRRLRILGAAVPERAEDGSLDLAVSVSSSSEVFIL